MSPFKIICVALLLQVRLPSFCYLAIADDGEDQEMLALGLSLPCHLHAALQRETDGFCLFLPLPPLPSVRATLYLSTPGHTMFPTLFLDSLGINLWEAIKSGTPCPWKHPLHFGLGNHALLVLLPDGFCHCDQCDSR